MLRRANLKTGFTLLELLVVISVLAILMSILAPSLKKAKETSRRTVCTSNLKQFGTIWVLYAMDNDDLLCLPMTSYQYRGYKPWGEGWGDDIASGTEESTMMGTLWPYTESIELYSCPSARYYKSIHRRSKRLRDYSISRTMGYSSKNWWGEPCNSYRKFSEITSSSDRMVFIGADGAYGNALENIIWMSGHLQKAFWPFSPNLSWTTWEFSRLPDAPLMSTHIITARHNNGCNMNFADGHVEYWKYEDPRTVKLAMEETTRQDEIDFSKNNPDLEYMKKILKEPHEK